MKFIVSSTGLFSHLQAIARVINSKNSLPILDCFLLEITDGTLSITASDSETTLTTSLEVAEYDTDGRFAVNSKTIHLDDDSTDVHFIEQDSLSHSPMLVMEDLQLYHNHLSGYRNGVRFVVAGPNETYASLALFLNMYERTLRKYNDALDTRELKQGDIVYIYPKKNRAERRYPTHYFKGNALYGINKTVPKSNYSLQSSTS